MKPIYEPKGAAKEYGDYAINIYTGCPHRCYYCFAPSVLRKDKDRFHSCADPRKNIVNEVSKQIERDKITGKMIHLCFTCDPYPTGCDSTPTREIIKILKDSGNHVQILTKGYVARDFDLLDDNDWYGITYAGYPNRYDNIVESEPGAVAPRTRLQSLRTAHELGIKTWVSCEPVLDADDVLLLLKSADYIDRYKIGKLNYHHSDIRWGSFGKEVERICISRNLNYYIKDGLRKEMEAAHD